MLTLLVPPSVCTPYIACPVSCSEIFDQHLFILLCLCCQTSSLPIFVILFDFFLFPIITYPHFVFISWNFSPQRCWHSRRQRKDQILQDIHSEIKKEVTFCLVWRLRYITPQVNIGNSHEPLKISRIAKFGDEML